MEDYRRKGMKKTFMILFILGFSLGMISLANAGAWKRDSYGWWYQNDNGSWPAGKWEWIDKRMQDREGDGIAWCYYFDVRGYAAFNTRTPDGYQVNGDGAWVENGIAQWREIGKNPIKGSNNVIKANNEDEENEIKSGALSLYDKEPILYNGYLKKTSLNK